MKERTSWYSNRVERDVQLARWGSYGTPVLVFPTAGGDFEEIERFHLVGAVGEQLEAGRVKIYSCDSVNGRVLLAQEGDAGRRTYLLNQFLEYVRWEVVPAIRADCQSPDIEIITSGASIGAYNALAVMCRWPDVFRAAVCMSGTYDLARFVNGPIDENFRAASPLHILPALDEDGALLRQLRTRFVVLASGEGANEDIGESWRIAHELGSRRVPNRVDPWGPGWPHDWQTWRHMLPQYLDELV